MFFDRKPKLPITAEDKEWIDSDLEWLRSNLGSDHMDSIRTVTPTKNFYNIDFAGIESDAHFVLERTAQLMAVDISKIKLEFFQTQLLNQRTVVF